MSRRFTTMEGWREIGSGVYAAGTSRVTVLSLRNQFDADRYYYFFFTMSGGLLGNHRNLRGSSPRLIRQKQEGSVRSRPARLNWLKQAVHDEANAMVVERLLGWALAQPDMDAPVVE